MGLVKALSQERDLIDVLLSTEGTYPFFQGGVSTWCNTLINGVEGVRYQVYAVVSQPYYANAYTVPFEAKLIKVPLWGTEDPSEILDLRSPQVYQKKEKSTAQVVENEFLPLFDGLMSEIWNSKNDGRTAGELLYRMHLLFSEYDYAAVFKHRLVWDHYISGLNEGRWQSPGEAPSLFDAHQTFGWLYRFLVILSTPIPKVDVVHSSAAAFCGIPGILAKLHYGTPFLATEHGVYLREQYLSIGRADLSTFSRAFLIGLIHTVVAANYSYADLVAPVASFNARWEAQSGVPGDHIRIIYNGVDQTLFGRPGPAVPHAPTIVSVARIDPNKDIVSFIRAAARVKSHYPEARFVVYGGVSVPDYYQTCLEVRHELDLDDAFIFAGHLEDVAQAYASGDVVVLSSITEGFPYAVIEAMMSGRPVVATDVGGVREALADAGVLVQPRDVEAMAEAIENLLADQDLRLRLSEDARERAAIYFTTQRSVERYQEAYQELATQTEHVRTIARLLSERRRSALERAQSLRVGGQLEGAISEYRLAASLDPDDLSTSEILMEIAEIYHAMGEPERCRQELLRAEAHLWAIGRGRRAMAEGGGVFGGTASQESFGI